ncbi:MAG: phospholipase D-like domain-containing protein [Candidatus Micrarchaeota archaeon]
MDTHGFAIGFLSALLLVSLAGAVLYYFTPQPGGGPSAKDFYVPADLCAPCSTVAGDNGLLPSPLNGDCPRIEPLFSPGSGDEIRRLIHSSKKSIEIEIYVFTDETLVQELADAQKRGVDVRVILEARVNSASLDNIVAALRDGGVSVRWASPSFALTHAKTMIIDGEKVLVGSINFSKAAQGKNREAAAVIEGKPVADYSAVFAKDWNDALMVRPK